MYGAGQKTSAYYTSVINHFVDRIANGEPPIIDGAGEQSMDFVHVRDVARAVVAALDAEKANTPINIGTGSQTTIAELAEILIDAVGADVEPIFNHREVLVSRRCRRHHPRSRVLGWEPTISVDDGMAELARAVVS